MPVPDFCRYLKSVHFPFGMKNHQLQGEFESSSIVPKVARVDSTGDIVDVWFEDQLSPEEKIQSDLVVASHVPLPSVSFGASSGLIDNKIDITETSSWQNLGGRVTNISSLMIMIFGHSDMSKASGRVPFRVKSIGSGAEIRLVEVTEEGIETPMISTPHQIGDTLGLWKFQSFTTSATPAVGDRLYMIQARLNGAGSASIGEAAMSLLNVE